jgi:hypothetical protein
MATRNDEEERTNRRTMMTDASGPMTTMAMEQRVVTCAEQLAVGAASCRARRVCTC